MPYIHSESRKALDPIIDILCEKIKIFHSGNSSSNFDGGSFHNPGWLNYIIFRLAKKKCFNYNSYKNFIGELEMCKYEIYRRLVAPYEDKKIKSNGDVM